MFFSHVVPRTPARALKQCRKRAGQERPGEETAAAEAVDGSDSLATDKEKKALG